eukprot:618160-Pyramimonas_sp.AAC.1
MGVREQHVRGWWSGGGCQHHREQLHQLAPAGAGACSDSTTSTNARSCSTRSARTPGRAHR